MAEAIKYRGGIPSVRWRVLSTDLSSRHQYGERCAVQISHIISTDVGVQYTTKTA